MDRVGSGKFKPECRSTSDWCVQAEDERTDVLPYETVYASPLQQSITFDAVSLQDLSFLSETALAIDYNENTEFINSTVLEHSALLVITSCITSATL